MPGVQVEVVLRAILLTEGLTQIGQFNRERRQRRRAPTDEILERVGKLVVAIPLSFAQPINELVSHIRQVTRQFENGEDRVADVLERVRGKIPGEHAAESVRIAACASQRLEPGIVTHAHLRARRYEKHASACPLARNNASGQYALAGPDAMPKRRAGAQRGSLAACCCQLDRCKTRSYCPRMTLQELDPEIAAVVNELELPAIDDLNTLSVWREGLFAAPPLSDAVVRTDYLVPGDPNVAVRVHRAGDVEGLLPCIYSMHPGGYVLGSYSMDDPTFDQWCPKLGVVGISVEYRLAPETRTPARLRTVTGA